MGNIKYKVTYLYLFIFTYIYTHILCVCVFETEAAKNSKDVLIKETQDFYSFTLLYILLPIETDFLNKTQS